VLAIERGGWRDTVRNAWGNFAPEVSADDVRLRRELRAKTN
jgi:hypothetical protein